MLHINKKEIVENIDYNKCEIVEEILPVFYKCTFTKEDKTELLVQRCYNDLIIDSQPVTGELIDYFLEKYADKTVATRLDLYKPFSDSKLLIDEYSTRIVELKKLLSETDYRAIKYAEGEYTEEEYAPYKALRKSYRDEINHLEEEISKLKD